MTSAQEPETEKPPLFQTWRAVYTGVLSLLGLYVLLMALFRGAFS